MDLLGEEADEAYPGCATSPDTFLGYSPRIMYIWAMYYACMTFTTIGYGDMTP